MKRNIILILLVLFANVCVSQDLVPKGESKNWRKSKKISIRNGLKFRVLFSGPDLSAEIKADILREMNWFSYAKINPKFSNTGKDCDYCGDLERFIQNIDESVVYVYEPAGRELICEEKYEAKFSDLKELQNEMINNVLSNGKKLSDVLIIIPAKDDSELKELQSKGWQTDIPMKLDACDKITTHSCDGKEVVLYKQKPCTDFSQLDLLWKDETGVSLIAGDYYLFPSSNVLFSTKDQYRFFLKRACSSEFYISIKGRESEEKLIHVQVNQCRERGFEQLDYFVISDKDVSDYSYSNELVEMRLKEDTYDVGKLLLRCRFVQCPK
jgi:predicted amidophosphoribosyltransferase